MELPVVKIGTFEDCCDRAGYNSFKELSYPG